MQDRHILRKMIQVFRLRKNIHNQLTDEQDRIYFEQLPVLQFIHQHPGCMQKEIAEEFEVSKAAVTKSVHRMINSKMIDKKENGLYLTELAIEKSKLCMQDFKKIDDICFDGFSQQQMDLLSSMLDQMIDNLKKEEK